MNLYTRHETKRRLLQGLPDANRLQVMLDSWFQSSQGSQVLASERELTAPIISRLFGYHILQIGCHPDYSLIQDSPAGHKIQFSPTWRPGQQAVADIEELPLGSDSIDVVVIHHALDFTEDSHRLLREATRVLRPGGRMLVIGFNPVSHWGFWRLLRRKVTMPWRGRFISRSRLSDWLRLLDLKINRVEYALHFPPWKFMSLLQYAQRIEEIGHRMKSPFGGAYVVLCVKQVAPITPIVPRWQPLSTRQGVFPAAEKIRARRLH